MAGRDSDHNLDTGNNPSPRHLSIHPQRVLSGAQMAERGLYEGSAQSPAQPFQFYLLFSHSRYWNTSMQGESHYRSHFQASLITFKITSFINLRNFTSININNYYQQYKASHLPSPAGGYKQGQIHTNYVFQTTSSQYNLSPLKVIL